MLGQDPGSNARWLRNGMNIAMIQREASSDAVTSNKAQGGWGPRGLPLSSSLGLADGEDGGRDSCRDGRVARWQRDGTQARGQ